MVEIIKESREFTEVEKYLMTVAPSIKSMKDVPDGTVIEVDGTLLFKDTKDSTGETVEILSLITPDLQVYSCQSKTFKKSLEDITNIMNGKEFAIVKISGKTNAGRDYINCTLDVNSVR